MDNHKIVPIIKHCKRTHNFYTCGPCGRLPLFYKSSNIIRRRIYIRAYIHIYAKLFQKAQVKTNLNLYSGYPIYDMISVSSTEPTDSDIKYFERSMSCYG